MAGAAEPQLTACRIRAQLSEFCGHWRQSSLFSAGPSAWAHRSGGLDALLPPPPDNRNRLANTGYPNA